MNFFPVQLPTSPTALITKVPFDIETSHIEEKDYKGEIDIINLQTEGQEHEPKHVKLELRRPKTNIVLSKNSAYHHKKDPVVISIKKWYQIRGWALLYPLIVSLYLAICELEFNFRMLGYAFIACSCICCFVHLKNFESKTNTLFILLNILCILVVMSDFLFQFSFVGNRGWKKTGSYQECFNFSGIIDDKEFQREICNVFKALYYFNYLVYLASVVFLAVYLLATSKLVKLVKQSGDGNGYMTKLKDEVETED